MQCLVLAIHRVRVRVRARARARARARKAIIVKSIMVKHLFGYRIEFRRTRTRTQRSGTRTRWLFEPAAMPIVDRGDSREFAGK